MREKAGLVKKMELDLMLQPIDFYRYFHRAGAIHSHLCISVFSTGAFEPRLCAELKKCVFLVRAAIFIKKTAKWGKIPTKVRLGQML